MRLSCKLALAFGAVVLMAGTTLAQRPGMGMMGMGGGLQLLGNKGVQNELKLDTEQTEKVAKYVEETMAKRREQFEKLQDLPQEGRREKMMEIQRAAAEETQKAVKELLKPEQVKRFNQIELQQRGITAFGDPAIRQQMKFNEAQAQQIREIIEGFGSEMREIFQNSQGNFQEARKQMDTLRKEKLQKATALFTPEQLSTWKELNGQPFEVKFEQPTGRRPGGQ